MVFEPYLHLRITPEGSKKSKMTPKLSFKSKSKVELVQLHLEFDIENLKTRNLKLRNLKIWNLKI